MQEYYHYDDVPEIRTIKVEEYEKRNIAKVMVNILNDSDNKGIFGLDKFSESVDKNIYPGSIVKVKDGCYSPKWGIVVKITTKEYPKILPSHKLSKIKTEVATTYDIIFPCGFSDVAYGTETYGPSKEHRIIPMDVPFTVDTIPAYMESIEEKAREDFEKEIHRSPSPNVSGWILFTG